MECFRTSKCCNVGCPGFEVMLASLTVALCCRLLTAAHTLGLCGPRGASTLLTAWLQVAAVPFLWSAFLSLPANQQPFYSGFQAAPASAQQQTSAADAASNRSSQQPVSQQPSRSRQDVGAEVARAVRAVHGQDVGWEVPLVQAGLDSLGAPAICCWLVLNAKLLVQAGSDSVL